MWLLEPPMVCSLHIILLSPFYCPPTVNLSPFSSLPSICTHLIYKLCSLSSDILTSLLVCDIQALLRAMLSWLVTTMRPFMPHAAWAHSFSTTVSAFWVVLGRLLLCQHVWILEAGWHPHQMPWIKHHPPTFIKILCWYS